MTIIEKIFSRAVGKDVRPGDYVWSPLELVAMRDFGGPNVIQEYTDTFGDSPVFAKNKIAITFDLHIPARDEKVARNHNIMRQFAMKQGVKLFDIDTGIGQHILFEHGLVRPWDIIIGTDSHMNLLGAFGAAAFGVGTTDITGAMYKGKLWFRIPKTIKIVITGMLSKYVTAKDVILYILKNLTTTGALDKALEFSGETVERMNIAERITMTSMVTEMSGDIGFIEPTDDILTFLKTRTQEKVEPIRAASTASYEKVYEFSVQDLKPQIACPHSPDKVTDVEELSHTEIDQIFIGSCTNGRFEDLKIAATILKGKKIKKGVRLIIVPATIEVAREALKAGLYEIFLSCGAVVTNPGCALCTTGHPGILAPGETMVSTSNRNFVGKLGKGAAVYLVSPATAAATAITGIITDPREI
jgi:3-isopropylmalate/(R)-2-methylmalate dehydratase large subunit